MSELRAGDPKREAMLRRRMLEELQRPRREGLVQASEAEREGFAEAFVRASRPPGASEPFDLT